MIRRFLDTIGGVYELGRLGVKSRFRMRGAYWSWRYHTAFGKGPVPSRLELVKAALDYGKWVHRMRRGI